MSTTPVPAKSQSRALRLLSTGFTLALIGMIAVAAYWLVMAYRVVQPARPSGPLPATPHAAPESADWLLAHGGWSVGDTSWQVTRASVSSAELEVRLKSGGPDARPVRGADALETEIVEWLKRAGSVDPKSSAGNEYTFQVNTTRFRGVIDATPGGDRLRFGQVAWPDGADRWQLVEVVPVSGEAGSADPLLPLPAGASVVARRWSEGRRVVAELIGPVAPDADPSAEWGRAGWRRTTTANGPVPTDQYRRGSEVREVWRLPGPPGASGHDFLLVFVPPNREKP